MSRTTSSLPDSIYRYLCSVSLREPDTETIREVNRRLHADARAAISLVPIGDGLTLALKA